MAYICCINGKGESKTLSFEIIKIPIIRIIITIIIRFFYYYCYYYYFIIIFRTKGSKSRESMLLFGLKTFTFLTSLK